MRLLSNSTLKWPGLALAPLLVCGVVATARASITMPDSLRVDANGLIKDIMKDLSTQESCGARSTTDVDQSPKDNIRVEEVKFCALLALAGVVLNSQSGTSTTSTSPGGGSTGFGGTPIHNSAASATPDLKMTGSVAGEARLALPLPPVSDLLRPPQSTV